jgi:hypothetical protein
MHWKFPYIIGGYFAKVEPSNVEPRPLRAPGGSYFRKGEVRSEK